MSNKHDNDKYSLDRDEVAAAAAKYDGLPVPKTPADVAALFSLITKAYPNSLLQCSGMGSEGDGDPGFTMTHIKLIEDLAKDARKHGCELEGVAENVKVSEASIYLTMMTSMIYNICVRENYDPVETVKLLSRVIKDAVKVTRESCVKFLSQM